MVRWGYDLDTEVDKYYFKPLAHDANPDIDMAIRVPAEMLQNYKNMKITGIEFFNDWPVYLPDYVFITKPGTDYLVKQNTDLAPTVGWKNVYFPEPFVITGEELFVGIGRKGLMGSPYSPNDLEEDGSWIRAMIDSKQWEHIPDFYHPWPIRFIIEGENLPTDVRLCQSKVEYGDASVKFETHVVNRCSGALTSYTIKWDIDGKVNGIRTIETSLASNMSEPFVIDIPSDMPGYYHTLTLDVVSVNGEDDDIPANSHLVYEYTSSATYYPRTMVLENYVGTWCPYTPRAYAMAEKMYNKYPDNFLSIAIHRNFIPEIPNDVGEPYNYSEYIVQYDSTPTIIRNRTKQSNNLDEVYTVMEEQKYYGAAKVYANAVFASTDETSVKVRTSCTYGFTDDVDFRIAYVVVEDNVGPYNQSNAYTDPTSWDNYDGYLDEWFKKGSPVEMLFNDVARGIYPGLNGLDGSVPTSVVAGQPYEYEYTLELPDNIQDKKNIRIVTLLIDNKSGEIMNADQTKVIIETDIPGDANNDGVVDSKDTDAIVRYVMAGDIKGFNFKNADVNGDNKINAADIVEVMNIIKTNK